MSASPIEQPEVLSASELRALLLQYRKENWQSIQTPEWQERIVDDILNDDGVSILRRLSDFWQMPSGALILDVGSGVGSFVVGCRRQGLLAFGIEPDRIGRGGRLTSIQIARRRLKGRVFAAALGEKLPFPDHSFDLVTMNQVIEHVGDQTAVLREALRVTRDGGAVYIACPNYLRFYEPHYKIFWLPLLPKMLGRWYLKLRGRNPVLLDQLTYTTNNRLRAMISRLGADYTIIDLHREQFLRKCSDLSFTSRRAQFVAKAAHLPGLRRLINWAALLFLRATEGGCEMMILSQQRSTNISC
jgi:SAM-dependent methyltransferase